MSNKYKKYLERVMNINSKSFNLTQQIPSEKVKPKYPVYKLNLKQQLDLLHLPTDKEGYKYLLVLIDFNRYVEAEPIKTKTADEVIKAIKNIYNRSKLNFPFVVFTDPGSEFNNKKFTSFYVRNYTNIRHNKTGRHRQSALVESFNKIFSTVFNTIIKASEIKEQEEKKEWRQYVKIVRDIYNENNVNKLKEWENYISKNPHPITEKNKPYTILSEGTLVRIPLEEPIRASDYKKENVKKFRVGDIRWDPTTYKITDIILHKGQPVMYKVNQPKNILYTKENLFIIPKTEIDDTKPEKEKLKKGVYIAVKILEKRKVKNRIQYLILWNNKETSWESRIHLKNEMGDTNLKILENTFKMD